MRIHAEREDLTLDPLPKVGMGATERVGSDRYAYTIVEVLSTRRIVVQRDHAKSVGDCPATSECQSYEYSPDPQAPRVTVTLRTNGRWVRRGGDLWAGAGVFSLGHRSAYRDPSF